ncbi:MAG: hypothetical protein MMC23_007967 [Stictis urceolatum]|nr:hypothetical protein [Stictis urceolata]
MRIGDLPEVLKALFKSGEDVNGRDVHGWTALNWAVAEDRLDPVKLLLRSFEVNVNRTNRMADGPLHVACQAAASEPIIEALLDHPYLNINMKNEKGWSILHWALRHQKMSLTLLLTGRDDLDMNSRDDQGSSYLDLCFFYGLGEDLALQFINHPMTSADWFKKRPGRITTSYPNYVWVASQSYLYIARNWSWHRIESLILSQDPLQVVLPDAEGLSLLERCVHEGVKGRLVEILESLPKNVFTGSGEGSSLLHLCTQQDWEDISLMLVQDYSLSNTYRDKRGRTMLHHAAEYQ